MEKLKVKKITLNNDGSLLIDTNISDNLELAKLIDKSKMENILNVHSSEFHFYQNEHAISSISYMGHFIPFKASEFHEFLEKKYRDSLKND